MINNLSSLAVAAEKKSRSISAENFRGEKGRGGAAVTGIGEAAAENLGAGWKISPAVKIKAGEVFLLADINDSGIIKHMWFTEDSKTPRSLILRIYWDGSSKPSVEAPLADFFACAGYQNAYKPINSLSVCVNPARGFNCYWEMPFGKNCKITVENISAEEITLFYQIDYELAGIPRNALYFHAQFRRVNPLPYKEVYTILDNVSGKGKYVGTYLLWGVHSNGWWGEGEVKFYLDGDEEYPTICGTGTEDYFGGSWNFDVGGRYCEYSNAYTGFAKAYEADGLYKTQTAFSMYRWHICDPVYFDKDIKVTVQALGWKNGKYLPLRDDISSVAFWYQNEPCQTFPPLPEKDCMEIV